MISRLLGNRLIVEHDGDTFDSKLILVPETATQKIAGIRAVVTHTGSKLDPEIKVGDSVIMPSQFGDRGWVKDNPKAIIYHGDDVLAKVLP